MTASNTLKKSLTKATNQEVKAVDYEASDTLASVKEKLSIDYLSGNQVDMVNERINKAIRLESIEKGEALETDISTLDAKYKDVVANAHNSRTAKSYETHKKGLIKAIGNKIEKVHYQEAYHPFSVLSTTLTSYEGLDKGILDVVETVLKDGTIQTRVYFSRIKLITYKLTEKFTDNLADKTKTFWANFVPKADRRQLIDFQSACLKQHLEAKNKAAKAKAAKAAKAKDKAIKANLDKIEKAENQSFLETGSVE